MHVNKIYCKTLFCVCKSLANFVELFFSTFEQNVISCQKNGATYAKENRICRLIGTSIVISIFTMPLTISNDLIPQMLTDKMNSPLHTKKKENYFFVFLWENKRMNLLAIYSIKYGLSFLHYSCLYTLETRKGSFESQKFTSTMPFLVIRIIL